MSILNKESDLEEFELDRMGPLVHTHLGGVMPRAQAMWTSLQAAESEIASKLTVFLEPTEIFPLNPPTEEELLELDGKPYLVEPGYDMEGGMLGTFHWSTIKLRNRPIIKVHSVKFVYPTIAVPIYNVPLDWVYADSKAGMLQFTPKPTAAGMAPSLIGASIMARGGAVPQMVRIRYRAGLEPNNPHMPEIRDLIMRAAILRHLRYLPTSSSISGDGLSQSKSFNVDQLKKSLTDDIAILRERILGPVWGVL